MEAQDEAMATSSKEQTQILKGKRTKRQRPQSPIPLAITTTTTNSSSGDNDTNTILTPTTSADEFPASTTQEEEDMANCLILLAQGQSREVDHVGVYKFNSRRYLETTAAMDSGKAGYCVYECKTCNRTFPSFQALGGHRASHNKLKAAMIDQEKKNFPLSDQEEGQSKVNNNLSPLSLQLGKHRANMNKSKIHECSVCGAEFTSGQALGGHMRRHRGPITANTSLSLTPLALEPEEVVKKPRNVLSLDLNLPAPEDDHRESKFPFAMKQQQQQQPLQQQSPLVFSAAPSLVDCHY